MAEKQRTYGEFIDLMEKLAEETGNVDAQIAIEDWKALATEKQWKEFRPLLLTSDLVINFAEDMASSFREHISGTYTNELYVQRKKDGHAFLKKVYEKAVELGVKVEHGQIDAALTPSEVMILSGYTNIKVKQQRKGGMTMAEKHIIKIVSIPEGPGIPEEIRKGWVGVVFEAEGPTNMVVGSVLDRSDGPYGPLLVYKVPSSLALAALKLQNKQSWEWFNSQPGLSPFFAFNTECCEVVSQ